MTKEFVEQTLTTSLSLLLGLSILDLFLYIFIDTAVLTFIAHVISVWLLLKFRLRFDLVKFIETFALLSDLYIISIYGYVLASPFASLISIIIISFKKEKYINKLKIDLEKIMISKKKDLEND